METTPKNTSKKYDKKPHKFQTINVANYLSSHSRNATKDPKIRLLLLKYLKEHREEEFTSYDDISKALRKAYALSDSQLHKGSISKAVRSLYGDLIFSDGIYFFEKLNGIYKLRPRFSLEHPAFKTLFELKNAFFKESVHCIDKNTLVFSVNPKHVDTIRNSFLSLLGSGVCFGIMYIDQHILVMLNEKDPNTPNMRKMLTDFFKQKKLYEERKKHEAAREIAIAIKRKKYQGHNLNTNTFHGNL